MTLPDYIESINSRYKLGNATEHTFRGDLQNLLESIVPTIRATNEPKRQSCGAPDYIITKKDIPLGFIEAKDIGDSDLDGLKKAGNKEQFDRYKASLSNIIFTDYLDFHLYRDGQFVMKLSVGEVTSKGIKPIKENFTSFESFIKDFCSHVGQTITSSKKLAELMASKARLLSEIIEKALGTDEVNNENSTLIDQMTGFKQVLIHDISPRGFADVYAQTITYGMFAARLHDPTLPTFSRQEAFELIPSSNPFLKKLFGYIAGIELDERIKWIVDDLVQIFLACNVEEMLKGYGVANKMEDPIIHFYEDFLSEYDPKQRKARGVWFTPKPVVEFIVRAVDDILKYEFGLKQGLTDTSTTNIKVNVQGKLVEQQIQKVQILDPATGTGTFLAEVVKSIHKKFEGQKGIWSQYVDEFLLPRLNGFELLMASYAMAHLKLDLLLKETGYKPSKNQRFRIYLTNSLEESHPDTGTLFANWLSAEANEANKIKRDTPVMCVLGNPPYAVSSSNKGEWIQNLISDYKQNLNERKINLDDDYIKFIRYGQYFIDKNGSGILAYISNNSFIDGITHRQMRKSLLESFDKIYILDLHGSAKKNEITPEAGKDENVFDIQQGVSINIFVKNSNNQKKKLAEVFHSDLFGLRIQKYAALNNSSISDIPWSKLDYTEPNYFFVPKDFSEEKSYAKGFKLDNLFLEYVSGFQTKRDKITIKFTENELSVVRDVFLQNDSNDIKRILDLPEDGRDWTIDFAKKDLLENNPLVKRVMYRPFDDRYTYFTGKSKGFVAYPRTELFNHLNRHENVSLLTCRQLSTFDFQHVFISRLVSDMCSLSSQTKETGYIFPLYLYPSAGRKEGSLSFHNRVPNLNGDILNAIGNKINIQFVNEQSGSKEQFSPWDLLDYIYAILHSPNYRKKYKEFLKIDFPSIPFPKHSEAFWGFAEIGSKLRSIHLLESTSLEMYKTKYPISGNNTIVKPFYFENKVFINEDQYFENIQLEDWEFYIGGYQPLQKWLKDRKGRILNYEDIIHFQKLVNAVSETRDLMFVLEGMEI